MKTSIKINGNNYFYTTYACGEFGEYTITKFYRADQPTIKKHIKRKFFLFGPILKTWETKQENFIECFNVGGDIFSSFDFEVIKEAELNFQKYEKMRNGTLEI